MSEIKIISVRDNPKYLDRAVDYLSGKWSIPRVIYHDCITHSITTKARYPGGI